MKRNGAEVLNLATCFVVGYPPCPSIRQFQAYIESAYGLPVVIGSHPIPQKYLDRHETLPFWREQNLFPLIQPLLDEAPEVKLAYN